MGMSNKKETIPHRILPLFSSRERKITNIENEKMFNRIINMTMIKPSSAAPYPLLARTTLVVKIANMEVEIFRIKTND